MQERVKGVKGVCVVLCLVEVIDQACMFQSLKTRRRINI